MAHGTPAQTPGLYFVNITFDMATNSGSSPSTGNGGSSFSAMASYRDFKIASCSLVRWL